MAARHRLGTFLLRHGRHFTEATRWGQKHWRWIRGQRFDHAEAQRAFEHYVAQVDHLDAQQRALDEQIAALAETDAYRERVARLRRLRGNSALSAMVILTELGALRRCSSMPASHPSRSEAAINPGSIGASPAGSSSDKRSASEPADHHRILPGSRHPLRCSEFILTACGPPQGVS